MGAKYFQECGPDFGTCHAAKRAAFTQEGGFIWIYLFRQVFARVEGAVITESRVGKCAVQQTDQFPRSTPWSL